MVGLNASISTSGRQGPPKARPGHHPQGLLAGAHRLWDRMSRCGMLCLGGASPRYAASLQGPPALPHHRLQWLSPSPILNRQLLAHFHCLSCDRPLETPVTGQ